MPSAIQSNPNVSSPEYSAFIALSRYARWLPEEKRRETWEETVDRYVSFWEKRQLINSEEAHQLRKSITNLDVMPSMRALVTAGQALEIDNVAGFNCSYTSISRVIDFDEVMYISECGTGVGFSCERQFVQQLPVIGSPLGREIYRPEAFIGVPSHEISILDETENVIRVADSKYGWASALRILVVELYNGNFNVTWDVSRVRPAGTPLKIFGGRASGAAPLVACLTYFRETFKAAEGRKLNSAEVHGLVCKIAEVVVSGGVRRSALISLSNLSDDRMRHAKSGTWWETHPEYGMANNSVCYTERPGAEIFMREWLALVESKSGERGIFNREAAANQVVKYGKRSTTDVHGVSYHFGTNPCSEIILRDGQFCNLTEVVVRPEDTAVTLTRKIVDATILGTLQATLTDFIYLSSRWKIHTEEEALLGVSLTGILDNVLMNPKHNAEFLPDLLNSLRQTAERTNRRWAQVLGIHPAGAITCVKPSGTVSQLVDSASGIHPRYSPFYIRTVRASVTDPLAKMMEQAGFPCEPDVSKPDSTLVFSFPMRSPSNAVFRDDMPALEQLELWALYQRNWCEHKPSVTIYVRDHEWMEVGAWVYKNFGEVSGVSFLPHSDHTYQQAPYQEIDEETYHRLAAQMPQGMDWSLLSQYELEDRTKSARTLACTAGVCEVVDL